MEAMRKEIFMEERTLPRYPAGKRELIFGLLVLLFGTFTWNSILYGGFCLGFALGAVALTGCSLWYLLRCGFRFCGGGLLLQNGIGGLFLHGSLQSAAEPAAR